MDKFIEPGP